MSGYVRMSRYGIADLIRFLLGVLLIQSATAIVVLAALRSDDPEIWLLVALLSVTLAAIAALWFTSIANHARRDAMARVKDNFSREREKIRVKAEREKTKVIEKSHQQIIKQRDRIRSRTNMKVGAIVASVLGLGAIMLFTQFMTFGMLLMAVSGGALAGYSFRARREYLARRVAPELAQDKGQMGSWGASARRVMQDLTGAKSNSG